MEVKRPLENKERHWKVEKMELLERFDDERREWESQWKVMQKKIEELYQEVKMRRENKLSGYDEGVPAKNLQFSVPVINPESKNDKATHMLHNSVKKIDAMSLTVPINSLQLKGKKTHHLEISQQQQNDKYFPPKTSKPENDALNEALREIARVSEELCRYQDEIRLRSNFKRTVNVSAARGDTDSDTKDLQTEKMLASCNMSQSSQQLKDNYLNKAVFNSLTVHSDIGGTPVIAGQPLYMSSYFSKNVTSLFCPENEKASCNTHKDCSPVYSTTNIDNSNATELSDAWHNNYDGLCRVSCLYDIGTLEKSNPKPFPSNITDFQNVTIDADTQNYTVPCSRMLCSNNLHSDSITLEHSSYRPEFDHEKAALNGKLAAKIDEFNRTVFKTGQGSKVFHEPSFDLLQHECQPAKLCDPLSSTETNISGGNETAASFSSCENSDILTPIQNVKPAAQKCQTYGSYIKSSYQNRLQEHNWTPSNLSGRPRSADSRSNYGVVEKLFKSYENKTITPEFNSNQALNKQTQSDFILTDANAEKIGQCLELLQNATGLFSHNVSFHWQRRDDDLSMLPEMPFLESSSNNRGFSRPARPANRRPPSRWATTRSPSLPPAIIRTAI
ncbi:hypothetical protein GDO86_009440 [Hymenochirus boettgeri]|uniref:SOGA 1/2-like coiled-coil domain-containing protein n=1 Tax=Hymenochirus boettgeri TaxID=247094 RepID=A0A8T2JG19_9PIPI|nr:hypothetical protein GDO86_009440 [Hymenochirus boettgeri]